MRPAQTRFTAMRDATREDYQLIGRHSLEFFQGLPDRILAHLRILAGDTGGYAVDRLTQIELWPAHFHAGTFSAIEYLRRSLNLDQQPIDSRTHFTRDDQSLFARFVTRQAY